MQYHQFTAFATSFVAAPDLVGRPVCPYPHLPGALLTSSDDTLEFDRFCTVLRGHRLWPCNSICTMALAVAVFTPYT